MGEWEDWPLRTAVEEAYAKADCFLQWKNRTRLLSHNDNRFAYATLLFGKDLNLVWCAMTLGYSFKSVGTTHDCILLYTPDVPKTFLTMLEPFWILKPVEYIAEDTKLTEKLPRYQFFIRNLLTSVIGLNPPPIPSPLLCVPPRDFLQKHVYARQVSEPKIDEKLLVPQTVFAL